MINKSLEESMLITVFDNLKYIFKSFLTVSKIN